MWRPTRFYFRANIVFIMQYINEMPLITKFDITFFADDTFLSLADKNLCSLGYRVNDELSTLNGWFCKNKLSINHQKKKYIYIYISINEQNTT